MDSESRDSEGFSRPVTPAHISDMPKRPKLEPKEDRTSPTDVVSLFFHSFMARYFYARLPLQRLLIFSRNQISFSMVLEGLRQ